METRGLVGGEVCSLLRQDIMSNYKNGSVEISDVRDGLTRKQRVILNCLRKLQAEKPGCHISTVMLYGQVLEIIDIGADEMQAILNTITEGGR